MDCPLKYEVVISVIIQMAFFEFYLFQVAAVNGHFPLVQLLVENGADVHAVNKVSPWFSFLSL